MVFRKRSTTSNAPSHTDKPQLGLRLHTSSERLHALEKERERLLRDVQKKKVQVDQMAEKAQESARVVFEKVAPIIAQTDALCLELHALFVELLAPGRLSASARKKVAKVRKILDERGMFGTADDPQHDAANDAEDLDESFGHDVDPFGPKPSFHQHSPQEVASAMPRGQGVGHESLRALFKRLALVVHPDRAAHETDREHRTAVMKQVTQAYDDGDLARLVELEKLWLGGATATSNGDDTVRCREIERIIRELRAQATHLGHELRLLKKSTMLVNTMNATLATAEAELDELKTTCTFVKSFRDGKITLAEFVLGPEIKPVDDSAMADVVFQFLTSGLAQHFAPGTSRARDPAKRGKPRKR